MRLTLEYDAVDLRHDGCTDWNGGRVSEDKGHLERRSVAIGYLFKPLLLQPAEADGRTREKIHYHKVFPSSYFSAVPEVR